MEYRENRPRVGTLVVAFNGGVYGLDLATGKRRWECNLAAVDTRVRIVVTDEFIYALGHKDLLCLDYPDGSEVWRVAHRHAGAGGLLLHGDRLLVASGGEVECFSLSGESLWDDGFSGKGYGVMALGVPGNVLQADSSNRN